MAVFFSLVLGLCSMVAVGVFIFFARLTWALRHILKGGVIWLVCLDVYFLSVSVGAGLASYLVLGG
jgi:hypothetical protein